jgi:hypothetical protein
VPYCGLVSSHTNDMVALLPSGHAGLSRFGRPPIVLVGSAVTLVLVGVQIYKTVEMQERKEELSYMLPPLTNASLPPRESTRIAQHPVPAEGESGNELLSTAVEILKDSGPIATAAVLAAWMAILIPAGLLIASALRSMIYFVLFVGVNISAILGYKLAKVKKALTANSYQGRHFPAID